MAETISRAAAATAVAKSINAKAANQTAPTNKQPTLH